MPCRSGTGARGAACPECGTANTWEARQGTGFRALVAEISGCASLAELAAVGKRLYALGLSHDQAGVAWSHYRLRKSALETAVVTLGAPARALIAEVEQAPARALPRLGARLYRLQHGRSAVAITAVEWRAGSGRPTRRARPRSPRRRHRRAPPCRSRGGGAFAVHAAPHGLAPGRRGALVYRIMSLAIGR